MIGLRPIYYMGLALENSRVILRRDAALESQWSAAFWANLADYHTVIRLGPSKLIKQFGIWAYTLVHLSFLVVFLFVGLIAI